MLGMLGACKITINVKQLVEVLSLVQNLRMYSVKLVVVTNIKYFDHTDFSKKHKKKNILSTKPVALGRRVFTTILKGLIECDQI